MKTLITLILLSASLISCGSSNGGSSTPTESGYWMASKDVGADDTEYYLVTLAPSGNYEYFNFKISNKSTAPVRDEMISSCSNFYFAGAMEQPEIFIPLSGGGEIAYPVVQEQYILGDKSFSSDISALSNETVRFYHVSKQSVDSIHDNVTAVNSTVTRCAP